MPDPRHLGLSALPSSSAFDLLCVPDPRHFAKFKTFELGSQSSSRHLDLVVRQVLGKVSLTNMPDPKCLDLAALNLIDCQVHVPWVWHACSTHVFLDLNDY